MPATYTYNDGIEDAKREIACAWEEIGGEVHMNLVLNLMGRLDGLKRPSRRKRKPMTIGKPLDKILDEDRVKGPVRWLSENRLGEAFSPSPPGPRGDEIRR